MELEIQFTKEEITSLLNINPNEKNKRILQYMENVFKVTDDSQCYSVGRGKSIIFKVIFPSEAEVYINLKLFILTKYKFKTSYDFNLCLKLIYFLMNNKELLTLKEVSDAIDVDVTNLKYYRTKMLNDIIASQDYCNQQVFANDNITISFELYETIQRTYKKVFNKLCNSNQYKDYLEIYLLDDDEFNRDYQVIGINDSNYKTIVHSLVDQGYQLVDEGYLFTNNKVNKYFKDRLYQIHLYLYGYTYTYVRTVYTLCHKFMLDNNFKQLVASAYEFYINNLK